ncbi:DUF3780 domain-containing protein [Vulgatibacter incomptus]|uniref:DUF3780 domain-containing protein n=1 Tax=Vulgatibacter incomptus TaxID=1391653 RepID=A0A0K1PGH6_9BACT|nr:DUF3780 domain-containing protein [Vulgatibacter incomptus]AKU92643.1 hypothetical protein AKJ08_3030 [Vulgatibacter incomptus]
MSERSRGKSGASRSKAAGESTKGAASKAMGLGFLPEEARHGFVLHLPSSPSPDSEVSISEHREFEVDEGRLRLPVLTKGDPAVRVVLRRGQWEALAGAFWAEATQRLKRSGLEAIRQPKRGDVPLHPLLGKELCVLAWAIEDADPQIIPEAIRNWEGLAPEERWWLYTMTAAATGQAHQRGIGWRKALRFALTENPITKGDGLPPRARKQLLQSNQLSLL